MHAIRRAAEVASVEGIGHAARRLKNCVANFAASSAITAASQVEELARRRDWSEIPASLACLEGEMGRLESTLRKWMSAPA